MDPEAEVQVEVHRDLGPEPPFDAEHVDSWVERDLLCGLRVGLADVEVELQGLRREDVRIRSGDAVEVVGRQVPGRHTAGFEEAEGGEDLGELRVDEALEAFEIYVVLANEGGERSQQVCPDVLDAVGEGVVGEEVGDEWQVDAEYLALERFFDREQQLVESVDDDRRVREEGEEARSLPIELVPVGEDVVVAGVTTVIVVENPVEVDPGSQDVVAADPTGPGVLVEEVHGHEEVLGSDVDGEFGAGDERRGARRWNTARTGRGGLRQDDAAASDEVAEAVEVGGDGAVGEGDEDEAPVGIGIEEVDGDASADACRPVTDEDSERADAGIEVEVGAGGAEVRGEARPAGARVEEERPVGAFQVETELNEELDAGRHREVPGGADADEAVEHVLEPGGEAWG